MNSIVMKNVSKEFRRYIKEKGFLKNFFKREYEVKKAVNNMNINIAEGEIVGLIGPNGSGKTTIMKMLSGLIMPTSGDIEVLNYKPFDKKIDFKKEISLVLGQKQQLWWDIPAIDNFDLNRVIYGIDKIKYNEILEELITMLKLNTLIKSPVRTLSLGERMKCELVAALIHSPKILFLDEPTIGLDLVAQKNVRDFIKNYSKKYNSTVLITSHYMEDIMQLCNRTIFIDNGCKYYDGTLENFIQLYGNECILSIELYNIDEKLDLTGLGEILLEEENKLKLKVSKKQCNLIRKQLLYNENVNTVTIEEMEASEIVRSCFEKGKYQIC